MNLELKSMSVADAKALFDVAQSFPRHFNIDFAVSVVDGDTVHGAIAMKADGKTCELVHLFTDGTALVGSLLYGAAWRAAKALGYKTIGL